MSTNSFTSRLGDLVLDWLSNGLVIICIFVFLSTLITRTFDYFTTTPMQECDTFCGDRGILEFSEDQYGPTCECNSSLTSAHPPATDVE